MSSPRPKPQTPNLLRSDPAQCGRCGVCIFHLSLRITGRRKSAPQRSPSPHVVGPLRPDLVTALWVGSGYFTKPNSGLFIKKKKNWSRPPVTEWCKCDLTTANTSLLLSSELQELRAAFSSWVRPCYWCVWSLWCQYIFHYGVSIFHDVKCQLSISKSLRPPGLGYHSYFHWLGSTGPTLLPPFVIMHHAKF